MTQLSQAGAAAQAQIDQPYYGLVYLALATLCYRADGGATNSVIQSEIETYVKGQFLPALPAAPDKPDAPPVTGRWQMEWGPAITGKNANLMFALSYRDTGAEDDPPVFAAVCIRGTDTASSYAGDITQIIEDLDAVLKVKWTDAVDGTCPGGEGLLDDAARIAQGSCIGLKDLLAATDGKTGQGVEGWLEGFLRRHPDTPVVVTGHSLGGCQTTVMALYLQQKLAQAKICPNPFAPPTAGNRKFAELYNAAFASEDRATGNLWWNDMDLVPQAYTQGLGPDSIPSLRHIPNLWGRYGGPDCPEELRKTIANWAEIYLGYEQPVLHAAGAGAARNFQLRGSVGSPDEVEKLLANMGSGMDPASWKAQIIYQHFPPVYHQLMSSQLAGQLADYPFLPPAPPLES